jgi:rhodanese-related sulfurtransferase
LRLEAVAGGTQFYTARVTKVKTTIIAIVLAAFFAGCESPPRQTIDSRAAVRPGISEMTPAQARPAVEAAYSQLVDVREPEEFAAGHAVRARNIPLATLATSLDRIDRNEPVFLICRTDNRSREAAKILSDAGFERVVVIKGGTEAWRKAGLPMKEVSK